MRLLHSLREATTHGAANLARRAGAPARVLRRVAEDLDLAFESGSAIVPARAFGTLGDVEVSASLVLLPARASTRPRPRWLPLVEAWVAGGAARSIPGCLVVEDPVIRGALNAATASESVGAEAPEPPTPALLASAAAIAAIADQDRIRVAAASRRANVRVAAGTVRIQGESPFVRRREIADRIASAVLLARAFATPAAEIAPALAELARSAPEASTRRRSMELFLAYASDGDAREKLLRSALADPDPDVRILAANLDTGEAGVGALREALRDAGLGERRRTRVLIALGHRLPSPELVPDLARLLDGGTPPGLLRAAIRLAGRQRLTILEPRIASLAAHPRVEIVREVAEALYRIAGEEMEPTFIALLARSDDLVRASVIDGLARRGSAAAVEPLLGFVSALPIETRTSRAARSAIDAIQSRLSGAEAGQLSVADAADPHGALSPAEDREGALSPSVEPSGHDGSPRREPNR